MTGILIVLLGGLIGLACYAVIALLDRDLQPMKTYRFDLYRRVSDRKGRTVKTSLTIYRRCRNPHVERISLAKEFPGFGVAYGPHLFSDSNQ